MTLRRGVLLALAAVVGQLAVASAVDQSAGHVHSAVVRWLISASFEAAAAVLFLTLVAPRWDRKLRDASGAALPQARRIWAAVAVLMGSAIAASMPLGAIEIVVTALAVGGVIGLIAWSPNLR